MTGMSRPFTNPADAQIAASLGLALNLLNTGQAAGAEVHLARVLATRPLEPDALQLLGLVRAMQGKPAEAEDLYRRSLSVRPNQAHVRFNLGNVLLTLGRKNEAIAAYREAIRLKADYADAHVNLASALESGERVLAERHYRLALKHQPASTRARVGLSALLNEEGRAPEAESVLREALTRPPQNPRERAQLAHNLGVALRQQNRFVEALSFYDQAKAVAPDLPTVDTNRGDALQQLGRFEEAIAAYRSAIATNPLNLGAHHDLNSLLYRLRRDGEFLRSYDEAEKRTPKSADLAMHKGAFLARADRLDDARESFARAVALAPDNAGARNGLAVTLTRLKDFDGAFAAFEEALRLAPNDATTQTNFAGTLLQAGDANRALSLAEAAVATAPIDQSALATLDLALRAASDARADALTDYENFVAIFDLDPPDGFADMEEFNRALNTYLNGVHTDSREHIDQTLKGGTQTTGRLFSAGHELVERLRVRIEEAVAAYIARMREAKAHPLLGRRAAGFAFSGSWSSRLHDCGFHTNHVHPKGWISSCYYVALPEAVADLQGKQGWLKFGEPDFDARLKDPVRRVVQPAPGRLVLFPSYMWHGTVPFHSSQSRTTVAFDAVPKS